MFVYQPIRTHENHPQDWKPPCLLPLSPPCYRCGNSSRHYILAGTQLIQVYTFVCTIPTLNSKINLRCKPPFSRILPHTWVNAVMLFYSYITFLYLTILLMAVMCSHIKSASSYRVIKPIYSIVQHTVFLDY